MNTSTPTPTATPILAPQQLRLPPLAAVRRLECPARTRSEILVRAGRVWLTREGWPDDVFLAAGERWQVAGAAILYLSAECETDALLEISSRPG